MATCHGRFPPEVRRREDQSEQRLSGGLWVSDGGMGGWLDEYTLKETVNENTQIKTTQA